MWRTPCAQLARRPAAPAAPFSCGCRSPMRGSALASSTWAKKTAKRAARYTSCGSGRVQQQTGRGCAGATAKQPTAVQGGTMAPAGAALQQARRPRLGSMRRATMSCHRASRMLFGRALQQAGKGSWLAWEMKVTASGRCTCQAGAGDSRVRQGKAGGATSSLNLWLGREQGSSRRPCIQHSIPSIIPTTGQAGNHTRPHLDDRALCCARDEHHALPRRPLLQRPPLRRRHHELRYLVVPAAAWMLLPFGDK